MEYRRMSEEMSSQEVHLLMKVLIPEAEVKSYDRCRDTNCIDVTSVSYTHLADRNPAGFGGSMPFNPDNLGTALWNHNVVYRIGSAVDMEGYVGWIIRIDFTVCIYCDTGDDIGIYPVSDVRSFQTNFGKTFIAYNSNPQGRQDLVIIDIGS